MMRGGIGTFRRKPSTEVSAASTSVASERALVQKGERASEIPVYGRKSDLSRDPYAPPRAEIARVGPPKHAPGKVIAILYGAALASSIIARGAAFAAGPPLQRLASVAIYPFHYAQSALALAWLYAAWKGVPESHRGTISPRRAVLSLFIPVYNAYWSLAVNLALCDTLNGILTRARSSLRAPRTLALTAGAAWLGTIVLNAAVRAAQHWSLASGLSLVTPALTGCLWLAYMVRCDQARDAVTQLGDSVGTLGAPRLSELQRQRGPGVLAVIGLCLLIPLGLACWQLLSPGDLAPSATQTRSTTP
jgi:hypothetical protein